MAPWRAYSGQIDFDPDAGLDGTHDEGADVTPYVKNDSFGRTGPRPRVDVGLFGLRRPRWGCRVLMGVVMAVGMTVLHG